MKIYYGDILSRISVTPSWWDDNGVPRYGEFHPELAPNIYAEEVALYLIKCQACEAEFKVTRTWDKIYSYWSKNATKPSKLIPELYYGDPPNNRCCSVGPTMNSVSVKVLEFWQKRSSKWFRVPGLEVNLIDISL
jgi:hypothetical protein